MTQEEKINLRERAYRIAHDLSIAGTSSHALIAEECYRFLEKAYRDGETKEVMADEIDWSKSQKFKLNGHGLIVLSTGKHDADAFCGHVVGRGEYLDIGFYSTCWPKQDFTPCQ